MRRKILFVDDEPFLLRLVKLMLAEYYEVDAAISGEEGLQAIRTRGPYAAIVADLGMSGMDGASFLKATSELVPSTPRLAVTGGIDAYEAPGEQREFPCFPKPFTAESFHAAVSDAIAEFERARSATVRLRRLRQ